MLTPDEVWQKVWVEISGDWDRPNHHGIALKRRVVRPPELRDYVLLEWPPRKPGDYASDGHPRVEFRYSLVKLWLVLEEKPDTRNGYKIVYDERADQFGLAIASGVPVRGDTFIGVYGSFLETLEAM
jgi:hypothetical protein